MNKIYIELHTDNNYVIPTIVTLTSLFKNKNEDSVYEVRVLGNKLTQENVELLEKALDGRGQVIPHESSLSKFEGTHPHVSSTDLFKFDLPEVLSDWDKVLYIDTDMIIQGDLSDLFNVPLGDNYIAAVKDMAGMVLEQHHTRLGLNNYFNAGMMLMNLEKMRKEDIGAKLIDYKLHKDTGHFMSQDALNDTFHEKVIWLHPKYNWMAPNHTSFTVQHIASFFDITESEVLELDKKAVIVHLTNKMKPWDYKHVWGHKLWKTYYEKSILKHVKRHYNSLVRRFGWQDNCLWMFGIPVIRINKNPDTKKTYVLGIRIKVKKRKKI